MLYKNSFYYDDINKKYVFNQNNQIYDFNFWNLDIDSPLRIYGGIGADDVFNTIYVFLYNQIFNSGTKWLIYEKQIERIFCYM